MPLIAVALIVGGLVIHLAGMFMIQVSLPVSSPHPEQEPFVVFLSGREGALDPILAEQAALRDPASLFLPTRWNHAADINQIASLQDETELFSPYPARLTIPGFEMSLVKRSGRIPGLTDLARAEPHMDLRGFGRTDRQMGLAHQTLPDIEIMSDSVAGIAENLQTGRRLEVVMELGSLDLPAANSAEPAATIHQVAYGRIVGGAHIDLSSGFTELDDRLLRQIQRRRIEPSLGDGYWRITWYPRGK